MILSVGVLLAGSTRVSYHSSPFPCDEKLLENQRHRLHNTTRLGPVFEVSPTSMDGRAPGGAQCSIDYGLRCFVTFSQVLSVAEKSATETLPMSCLIGSEDPKRANSKL